MAQDRPSKVVSKKRALQAGVEAGVLQATMQEWVQRMHGLEQRSLAKSARRPEAVAGRRATLAAASIAATNPRWLAPEVLAGRSYDCSCDGAVAPPAAWCCDAQAW